MSISVFVFQICMAVKYHQAAFSFRYPIIWLTLYFGGMLVNIWIWSGHACASIISTPFCWHSFLSIIPISSRIAPYISVRLYFGANTI